MSDKRMPTPSEKRRAARARSAAQRAAAKKSEQRRRIGLAAGAVLAVLALIGALVAVGLTQGTHSSSTAAQAPPVPSQVLTDVRGVPGSTFASIGKGGAQSLPKPINGPALTQKGKPLILYVGAEFCPYCAAERWPVVVALSRFGTFTALGSTHSASSDVFPNTATFSFHGASYTSDYVVFEGVETESNQRQGNGYAPLDPLTATQQKLVASYDRPPYSESSGGIPFIDFANRYIVTGASYSPQILAGKSLSEIADALDAPQSDVAKAIIGSANVLTATICQLTGNQPAYVCGAPSIAALRRQVGGSS